jgi:hypothetical protein
LSPVVEAIPHPGVLYRVGRKPDPLVLPPLHVAGQGRFDDPDRQFRVLYVAERQRGCFVEVLAQFRPSLPDIAAISHTVGIPIQPMTRIPADWCRERRIARLRLRPGVRWLDLRAPETCEALRVELVQVLQHLQMIDFDVSGARGPSRELTQTISRWAFNRGFAGIAYRSRFDDRLNCWAIFERDHYEPIGRPLVIRRDNPDLRAAVTLFGLTL